ncbi:MAG: hypothetical protein GX024_11595 [Clostridiales bacterium]|nr:hypothetical protein [Clostridiales bacterium]
MALPLKPLTKPIMAKIKTRSAKTGNNIHPMIGMIPKMILPIIAKMSSIND